MTFLLLVAEEILIQNISKSRHIMTSALHHD